MRRTWAVPTGSLVLGLTAYAFLIVTARRLDPQDYAPLAALWALVFALAPALFLPLEQEVGRLLARVGRTAPAPGAVLRAAWLAALVGVAATVLLAAPFLPDLLEDGFDGSSQLLAGLGLSLIGYAAMHVVRGALLGGGRIGLYGASIGLEGALRLGGAVGLALLAVTDPGPYGVALGVAPLLVAVLLLPAALPQHHLPDEARDGQIGVGRMLRTLSLLVLASVLSLALLNVGPVAVKLLAEPGEAEQAGRLLTALVLARLPIFAFPTLQAALLPRFARLAGLDDRAGLTALARTVIALHLAAALLAAAVAALAGPTILAAAFGSAYQLPRRDLAVLAVGAIGHLLAMLLGLVLVAQGRSAALAISWLIAAAAAVLTVAAVPSLLLRVELGLLAGAWAAVGAITWAVTRTGSPAAGSPSPATAGAGPSR